MQKDEGVEARIKIPERTILDSVFSPPISHEVQSEIDRLDEAADNQASSLDDWGIQIEPEYRGGGSNYSDWAFGFSISGATVTVVAGYLFHGLRTPISVATKDVDVAVDPTYFYVEYVFGSGAATVQSQNTIPLHDANTLRWVLYKARLTGGVVSIDDGDIYYLGAIIIPGTFA